MKEKRFFICEHCGNIVEKIHDAGVPIVCCGEKMSELKAGVVEASREKHIPVVNVSENKVTVVVGEVLHPMTDEHSITWVCLETDRGSQLKTLSAGDEPTVSFLLSDETAVAVYAYCNLHGLWKVEIK